MSLLGPLDEELNHRTSQPFRVPGTTVHRFYDRHWFEVVHPSGELLMLAGLGVYKNMGVADGFMVVHTTGTRQTCASPVPWTTTCVRSSARSPSRSSSPTRGFSCASPPVTNRCRRS